MVSTGDQFLQLLENMAPIHFDAALPLLDKLRTHWPFLIPILLIARFTYFRFFHPLSRVPGPFVASISRLWLLKLALSGRQHLDFMEAHRKYGPVVRVAPNAVIINDPENFQHYHYFDKSEWWLALRAQPDHVPHSTELDQRAHNVKKKRVSGAFSMSSVLKLESKADAIIAKFIEQLSTKFADTGAVCELSAWTHWVAFDIVMDLVFSAKPGFVEHAKDVNGLIASLHYLLNTAQFVAMHPVIMKILYIPFINRHLAPQPTDKKGPGLVNGFAYTQVRERFSNDTTKEPKSDILQSIIDYRDREGDNTHQKTIENEAVGPVLAGSDTTATVLRAAVLYVATNPRILRTLLAELDAAVASGNLSRPIVQHDQVRKLPYLDAVIQESLRIHPVSGAPMYRVVPHSGVVFNGYALPGGTQIGLLHWSASRNKDVYGDDVEVFRPERWLDLDEETKRRRRQNEVWFGQGAMRCTGMNVALMELYKIVPELFLNFEIEVANPVQPWKEENYLNFVMKDFFILLRRREMAA